MERIRRDCRKSEPEHDQRTDSVSDSGKLTNQTKKEKYEVC